MCACSSDTLHVALALGLSNIANLPFNSAWEYNFKEAGPQKAQKSFKQYIPTQLQNGFRSWKILVLQKKAVLHCTAMHRFAD